MNTMSAEEILEKHIGKIPVYNKEVYSGVIAAMKEFEALSSTPAGEDVEALALKKFPKIVDKHGDTNWVQEFLRVGFITGYNTALQNKVPVECYDWKTIEEKFIDILYEANGTGSGASDIIEFLKKTTLPNITIK